MRRHWMAAALAMSVAAGVAFAKLPPPTPEQVQAAEAKKEQDKAVLEKEKEALEKAQDRVVQHYKRTKGATTASAARGGQTESTNIPDPAVRKAPGDAGPKGGTKQSAEAHSAPAK
jgi:FtsP/CotA-like multicopper oxidase with cupredoxin domain